MLNRKSLMLNSVERQFIENNQILDVDERFCELVSGGSLGSLIYGAIYSFVTTIDATAGTVTEGMQLYDGYSSPGDIFPVYEEEEDDPIA